MDSSIKSAQSPRRLCFDVRLLIASTVMPCAATPSPFNGSKGINHKAVASPWSVMGFSIKSAQSPRRVCFDVKLLIASTVMPWAETPSALNAEALF